MTGGQWLAGGGGGKGKVTMAAAVRAQLWLDLLFPFRLPLRLVGGSPCPHSLCPGPPALCGQSRDPCQEKLGGDGGHVAEDNGHWAWPVTQFPPDLGVTKEVFPHLGVTPIPQKHLLDTPPAKRC